MLGDKSMRRVDNINKFMHFQRCSQRISNADFLRLWKIENREIEDCPGKNGLKDLAFCPSRRLFIPKSNSRQAPLSILVNFSMNWLEHIKHVYKKLLWRKTHKIIKKKRPSAKHKTKQSRKCQITKANGSLQFVTLYFRYISHCQSNDH